MRQAIINVGCLVKIIDPQILVRCGYPLCISEVVDTIPHDMIIDVMRAVGCRIRGASSDQLTHNQTKAYNRIAKALAYAKIGAEKFGGNERKIYTREDTTLLGCMVEALGKRRVVTGYRVPGCSPSSMYMDDGELPYLDDQQHHTLIAFFDPYRTHPSPYKPHDVLEIEASRVVPATAVVSE